MRTIRQILLLLKKDALLELRQKELVFIGIGMTVILSAMAGLCFKSAYINNATMTSIFPGMSWLLFLFCYTLLVTRNYEHDLEWRALDGLILAGITPLAIYFSKLIGNFLIGIILYSAIFMFMMIFSSAPGITINLDFILLVMIVVLAAAALSAICTSLVQHARLKTLLFPMFFLPLLFLILLIASELSNLTLINQSLSWNSPLIALLICMTVMYVLAGLNLIDYTLKR